jgi:hypothetical protein
MRAQEAEVHVGRRRSKNEAAISAVQEGRKACECLSCATSFDRPDVRYFEVGSLLLVIAPYLREPFLTRTTPNLLGILSGMLLAQFEPPFAALTPDFL